MNMTAISQSGLNELEFRLLNDWQREFPLVERPFGVLARELGTSEETVLAALDDLRARGHISRIGAVFRPHVLGWSTLAAVSVPPEHMEAVARVIDAYPEVNHNYEREHAYNLWFVVAASAREQVEAVLADIHRKTGLRPLDLPMLADFHIDLGFDLLGGQGSEREDQEPRGPHLHSARGPIDTAELRARLASADYALASALEGGLTIEARPFARLAAAAGMSEPNCLRRLACLLEMGVIRRLGVVVRHRELGYTANAMVVWDVPDGEVETIGQRLGRQSAVTLCYRRPRRLPDWRYNLFSMVHGRDRSSVLAELTRLREKLDLGHLPCQPLFSRRRFKQCGARYSRMARAA